MANNNPKAAIEGEIVEALSMQQQLATLEASLAENEQFKSFLKLRKEVNDKMASVRNDIKEFMIPAYIAGEVDKSIKGDWGSITVTETDEFEVDEKELPAKFFKKVVDTTKIRGTFQLEGKAPKGTKQSKKYGLMIKFKETQ